MPEKDSIQLKAWMFTELYPIMSACVNASKIMAYGRDGCVLNNFYPIMTTVRVSASVHGTLNGCVIVAVDTSFLDWK